MKTNLKGRLRNTVLGVTNSHLTLFEAVVNAIQSCEQRVQSEDLDLRSMSVKVRLVRSDQQVLEETGALPDVIGFEITDTGIGFTSTNQSSFDTLDSEEKLDLGCKGIGRLVWLKAFKEVRIRSSYIEEGDTESVAITFDRHQGSVIEKSKNHFDNAPYTVVSLREVEPKYSKSFYKKAETFAEAILEHCIWYFLREKGVPEIIIEDSELDDPISLNDLYDEKIESNARPEKRVIEGRVFDLVHVRLRKSPNQSHSIALAGNGRVVRKVNIGDRIPGLVQGISDEHGQFSHLTYVSGCYLDENVHPQREGFSIPQDASSDLFDSLSIAEIIENVVESVRRQLSVEIDLLLEQGQARTASFINNKAPRYKSIAHLIDKNDKINDPNLAEADRELLLHKKLTQVQHDLLEKGQVLRSADMEEREDYKEKLEEFLRLLSDVKQSDLVDYVFHRRTVIDILRNNISIDEDGSYKNERILHKIFMPMGCDATEVHQKDMNLWLIDESLAFGTYVNSDRTLRSSKATGSQSTSEPDILATRIVESDELPLQDNPILIGEPKATRQSSIQIVEFKKPMKRDNPRIVKQVLDYVAKVRDGKVLNSVGRPINASSEVPAYCYAICDLNSKPVRDELVQSGYQVSADGRCYYNYHGFQYKAFVKVMDFDHVVDMAEERNYAFFTKLGLPATRRT